MLLNPLTLVIAGSFLLTGCHLFQQGESTQAKRSVESETEKVSYSIGYNFGRNLKMQDVEVDLGVLLAGLQDGSRGKDPLLSEDQQAETMRNFQMAHMQKQNQKRTEDAEKNQQEGEAFLAQNKEKEGVQTTASGLQYKVVTQGEGAKPTAQDTVVTHYRGTLIDGTEFDSSYARNEPATFPVSGVIPGWTEVLQLMPVGSKYEVYVPAALGYGERGSGPKIGPNATLIFDVELLEIKKNEREAAAPAKADKKK
jgi:FKBP-type peptidyl-prolyl cis-trans isomerase FklB